jgi:hypothetical protein
MPKQTFREWFEQRPKNAAARRAEDQKDKAEKESTHGR